MALKCFILISAVILFCSIVENRLSEGSIAYSSEKGSGSFGERLPGKTFQAVLSGPSFKGVVTYCSASAIPTQGEVGSENVVFIVITRRSGMRFVIDSMPASDEEMAAAKRLKTGQTYRFPEALK